MEIAESPVLPSLTIESVSVSTKQNQAIGVDSGPSEILHEQLRLFSNNVQLKT